MNVTCDDPEVRVTTAQCVPERHSKQEVLLVPVTTRLEHDVCESFIKRKSVQDGGREYAPHIRGGSVTVIHNYY